MDQLVAMITDGQEVTLVVEVATTALAMMHLGGFIGAPLQPDIRHRIVVHLAVGVGGQELLALGIVFLQPNLMTTADFPQPCLAQQGLLLD